MTVFEVLLGLRVRNLELTGDFDGIRASVLTVLSGKDYFTEISQTETVLHENNVYFRHQCHITYRFDQAAKVMIKIFGVRENTGLFTGEIGRCQFDIQDLLMNNDTKSFSLPNDVFADVTLHVPGYYSNGVRLQFVGDHVRSPNELPLAPFFTLVLQTESRSLLLYKSEVLKLEKYPQWKPFCIPTYILTAYSASVLRVHCYNYNVNATDTLIGSFPTSIAQLQQGVGPINTYRLASPSGERVDEKTCFELKFFDVCDIPSFFNGLSNGLHVPVTVAVDLTASNGNPVQPNSLHFIHPHSSKNPTPYVNAMTSTLPSVIRYQANNAIGALGFGALVQPNHVFSQCFPLTGHPTNSNVDGMNGLVDAYLTARISVQPYAPTEYSEVIYHMSKYAKAESNRKLGLYFLLFIFTNGGLSNPRRTIDAIVDSAPHPMSVVFITLGKDQFPDIEMLESPNLKHSDGRLLSRNNVSVMSAVDLHKNDGIALIPFHISSYFASKLS